MGLMRKRRTSFSIYGYDFKSERKVFAGHGVIGIENNMRLGHLMDGNFQFSLIGGNMEHHAGLGLYGRRNLIQGNGKKKLVLLFAIGFRCWNGDGKSVACFVAQDSLVEAGDDLAGADLEAKGASFAGTIEFGTIVQGADIMDRNSIAVFDGHENLWGRELKTVHTKNAGSEKLSSSLAFRLTA